MARYQLSRFAVADLNAIWDFIATDNPTAADALIETFHGHFKTLAELPFIGPARDHLSAGLRAFPVNRYVIYYRRTDVGVRITRVMQGSRDIQQISWQ